MVPVSVEMAVKEKAINKESINKESVNKESINKASFTKESLNKESLKKESINKESLSKEVLNKEFLYKEFLYKESVGETSDNAMNVARYLDSLDYSSDSQFLVSAETSSFDEFDTQLEVYSVSGETCFPLSFNLNLLFEPKRLNPSLERLIYWRDPMKSAMIFAGGLSILLGIQRFSIIFVFPFLLLHIMLASVAGRMFNTIVRATNRDQGPSWREYEHLVLRLPRSKVLMVTCLTVERINDLLGHLKDLFLFKDAIDSMNFCSFLISLAFLGLIMNGTTIIIWIYIFVFSIPKLYELNKLYIDTKLDCMRKYLITMGNKFRMITSQ
ncbi:hypothetical protein KR032_012236 [Drosophila birchii]|nr:hypothetical protein KR032_012236 [Drosophila birchii]